MTRKSGAQRKSGHRILLVDDDLEYLQVTQRLLEREGHTVMCARSGAEALTRLAQDPTDLLLLDYYMPGMTGEDVVKQLRQFNPYLQIILQTGYASEQPPRELLRRLDIQGYYDKSEGPEKLLLWTDIGLKMAYTIQLLTKSRQGLRYILDVTPDLHKIQPLADLLQGILFQIAGLLGAVNSFLAVLPMAGNRGAPKVDSEGFLAILEDNTELVIRASTGRFVGQQRAENALEPESLALVRDVLKQGEIQCVGCTTIVPLRVGASTVGVVYLDRPAVLEGDLELLHIFANQAAVAMQNVQLYEMAALDPLTGTEARGFFDKWLLRELRTAFRSQQPLALLMVDIDGMKAINDMGGHLAGDQALVAMGQALRHAARGSDIVGRFGGDEFAVILAQCGAEQAERVGQRVLDFLQDKTVSGLRGPRLPLRASIGIGVLEPHTFSPSDIPRPISQSYLQDNARRLIQCADEALYAAKKNKGNQLRRASPANWVSPRTMEPSPA